MTCDCVNVKLCVDPADLNLPEKASIEETVAGLDDAKYTTPAGVAAAIAESACDCPPGGTGTGMRVWESDWFNIAASGVYNFTHNLSLAEPWKCLPRVIGQVTVAGGGWEVGDIVFADGSNFLGATATMEDGWAICMTENSALVSFGNGSCFVRNGKTGGYGPLVKTSVKCKLLINY